VAMQAVYRLLIHGRIPDLGQHAHMPPVENEEAEKTNEVMVQELVASGAIRSGPVRRAFERVDRKTFVPNKDVGYIYNDMPIRQGVHHLSAPAIYAEALEALLPLREGMSFLNVGSGSGYFSCLVSSIIGPTGTSRGIDIHPELIAFAEARAKRLGFPLEFRVGNCHDLDPSKSMRFDRIYVGACATDRAQHLYHLLEVGGVLVAPFQTQARIQQLRRVTRIAEREWQVDVLKLVQFAHLVEPEPEVPFGLPAPVWTRESHNRYPSAFRSALETILFGRWPDSHRVFPAEIWLEHIFPWIPKKWFVPNQMPAIMETICASCKVQAPAPDEVGCKRGRLGSIEIDLDATTRAETETIPATDLDEVEDSSESEDWSEVVELDLDIVRFRAG